MEQEQSSSPPSPSTSRELGRRLQDALQLLGEARMRSSAKQLRATLDDFLSVPSWPLPITAIENVKTQAQQFAEATSTYLWNLQSPSLEPGDYDVLSELSL